MIRSTALVAGIVLFLAAAGCPETTLSQPNNNNTPPPYSGLFVPTADVLPRVTGATYLLSFPPTLATQIGFSIYRIATINVVGGYLMEPWSDSHGVLGTASLKLHPLRPTPERWGLAGQVQWMGGGAVSGQGDGVAVASNIIAFELIASSPVRSIRTHFGAAFHTMPGSEFSAGWDFARNYNFDNMQVSAFISGEARLDKRVNLFTEFIWAAIDADDGYDSAAIMPIGTQIRIGGAYLKISSGILFLKFGSSNSDVFPTPPIIGVTYLF
jgi:hypothetical protein